MTPLNPHGSGASFATVIGFDKFDGFEVCWAGPHPTRDGFCFGSEDGRLLYTDEVGTPLQAPVQGSTSGEAINGVAFGDGCLAVSTRADITFRRKVPGDSKKEMLVVEPAGSHGITVTRSGYFVAPLGLAGLMLAKNAPDSTAMDTTIASPTPERTHYFYRAIVLRDSTGHEALVGALRRSGVGVSQFAAPHGKGPINTVTYPGLDVVDVCPLGAGGNSLSAAAVGADGTLILFTNILTDKKPVTIKFGSVKGKTYRLLSCRGHIFLLTSEALYVMANLAGRVLGGESIGGVTTSVNVMPMEAVDANLSQDKFLLIVLSENKVLRLALALWEATIPENFTPESLDPAWEERGVEQDTRGVAVG